MKKRKVSINIVQANVFALVLMAVAAIVLLIPYGLIWSGARALSEADALFSSPARLLLSLAALLAGVVVHELIHGVTWAHYARSGWRSISFGVMWKYLTPYCHCNEPMAIRPYQVACLMPTIVLGLVPAVAGLCVGSAALLVWAVIFIAAGAGDIWMAWLLTKERPDSTVLDHPSEAGYYVFENE